MVTAGDFRNGVTFEMDGGVYSIIEFQHVKPGKGAAFVRTKIRNVITGAVTEKTFNPNDKYPTAYIERKDMQYLYSDGDLYYFMDNETYEQIPINKSVLSDNFKFVKENMDCKVSPTRRTCSAWSPPTLWSWRSPRPSPASGAIPPNTQARHPGDRRGDPRAPVHQRGRDDPHRHPHRRVHGKGVKEAALLLVQAAGPVPAGKRRNESHDQF